MRKVGLLILTGLCASTAACVPPARQQPPPPQRPQQAPPPQPLPPPPPTPSDWRDMALSPGGWVYSAQGTTSQALFGVPASEATFILRCNLAARQVELVREGLPTNPALTIRTTSSSRALPATLQNEPMQTATAIVGARDPILDAIAFSRGRFTVEAAGLPMLVIPAWPEPARVIEDCRR